MRSSAGDELQRRILNQLPAHNQARSEALCSQYRKSAYLAHIGSLAHAGVAGAEDFGREPRLCDVHEQKSAGMCA